MTKRDYEVHRSEGGKPAKAWTRGVPFDTKAREQVEQTARLPWVFKHIAVMPDVHYGIGATVGTVLPTKGAIVPAAVGVDIGCGMVAIRTQVRADQLPDNLSEIRSAIEAVVPVGSNHHNDDVPENARQNFIGLAAEYLGWIEPEVGGGRIHPMSQMGTLGGGNHFIELCLDEADQLWLMLHSGSRGIGNRIGRKFIEIAKRECERWGVSLPHRDLAFLPEGTPQFDDYTRAVLWAQEYAARNRAAMLGQITRAVSGVLLPEFGDPEIAVNCHHNYVEREHHFGENVWVTRKGAVRARKGDLGIIPGSMGARSFIVRGKGNPESFHSCSHGAGRLMSRTAARKRFTVADHERDTDGVECRKDEGVIDETPGAYKSIGDVMDAQKSLVDVIHELRQVVCVKG